VTGTAAAPMDLDLLAPEIPAVAAAPFLDPVIDPAVGIVRSVRLRDDWPHDEPKTVMYRAELMPTAPFSSGGYKTMPAAAGRSLDHGAARASAIFEAVERYCLSIYDAADLRVASYAELSGSGAAALDPAMLSHEDTAFDPAHVRGIPLSWTVARTLADAREVLVPAQLVYLPYTFAEQEPVLRDPLTTGCAAGTALGPAVLRGLLEVVERDAIVLRHYRRLTPGRLDPALFDSPELDRLVRSCERYHLEVEFFDYSLDLPVPVVAVRVRDPRGGTPATTFGSKAAFDAADAALGALLEAVTFRGPIRSRAKTGRRIALRLLEDPRAVASLSERAFLWIQPEMAGRLDYLDAAEPQGRLPAHHRPGPAAADVGRLVDAIRETAGEILVCDVTTPDIRELGVLVVKVLIPGLQPMHLSEPDRRWTSRLLAYGGRADVAGLNPLPHPFL
jgi:ribosomal protein S12 methylthiotransferase accessory factor